LGFATYGMFRVRPAYKYSVEHSVYVRKDKRGQGIGKILLKEIIKKAEVQNFHIMVGVIDASNTVSMKLHEKEGFILTGIMKEVGYKFDKWLDAAFYQLTLKTPEHPVGE
jgi:phosphinothricin acetyltransferase